MVYVRKGVVLNQQPGWGYSIHTHYLLCRKTVYGHCLPPPWDQNVPVDVYAMSTPVCPILGVRAYQVESKFDGRSIIDLPEFDGRGGSPLS
jgi:hypothetical protein